MVLFQFLLCCLKNPFQFSLLDLCQRFWLMIPQYPFRLLSGYFDGVPIISSCL
jgi:hypothetical protein